MDEQVVADWQSLSPQGRKLDGLSLPVLKPAKSKKEYDLHVAALEWSLIEPIIINSAEDIKSKPKWEDKFQPFEHQVRNLMTFCRRLPVTLLADDVGLGKTISAGLIISELLTRKRISRVLVVAPKILLPQWEEEMVSKFGIPARHCSGKEFDNYEEKSVPIVITTYATMRNRISKIKQNAFDMLILDEAHKLRNLHGTYTPPKVAEEFRKVLSERQFKYVLMLTATPMQNRLWDLYSLVDLLTVAKGHKNPFGEPAEFGRKYIADPTTARHLKRGSSDNFKNVLRQYLARTRRNDAKLQFPKRTVHLKKVPPFPEEQVLVNLVAEHVEGLSILQQISVLQALMSSAEALHAQLLNMSKNNQSLEELAVKVREVSSRLGNRRAKIQGLMDLIRRLKDSRPNDWRAVIFTTRKETQKCLAPDYAASLKCATLSRFRSECRFRSREMLCAVALNHRRAM